MLSAQEEKFLLMEVAMSNENSFRRLYELYFHRVTAYVFKITKSEENTAEIVQDVFLKLWQNRAVLTDIENIRAYIYSLCKNKCIDYLRRLAREMRSAQALAETEEAYANSTDQLLEARDLQFIITQALQSLSDQKKQIFRLSKIEGLSHDEIADMMHLSKSTVKNHLSETLKYLRQQLKQRPDHEYILLLCLIKMYLH